MRKIVSILSICLVLTACAAPKPAHYKPSAEELATADYGKYPEDYKEQILLYLQKTLKDPDSAKYRYESAPFKDTNHADRKQDLQFLYRVRVFVNAKNSYGGYTGEHLFIFDFKNGILESGSDVTQSLRDFDRLISR